MNERRSSCIHPSTRLSTDNFSPFVVLVPTPLYPARSRVAICASGFRNPFRCGFDKKYPHELYCGDVGHEKVEEISLVE